MSLKMNLLFSLSRFEPAEDTWTDVLNVFIQGNTYV